MRLFTELGMSYPIIQAPMAGVQGRDLALAVTGPGGLGSLPAAMLTAAELRSELEHLAQSGFGPFNINFFCHQQREQDPAILALARWQLPLIPYYAEFGILPPAVTTAASRVPFNEEHAAMVAKALWLAHHGVNAVFRSSRGEHTALTNLFSGRPARGISKRLMLELGPLSDLAPCFPYASGALALLRAAAESPGG